MTRVRFTVSYDGTDFCGWQRQNQGGKPSVSQTIQESLIKLFGHDLTLFASGRTDAGVHAFNQVCHFDTSWSEEKLSKLNLSLGVQNNLPSSIRIKKAWIAPDDFHSTLSPDKKTYTYFVYQSLRPSVFLGRYSEWVRKELDLNRLNQTADLLLGEQDFKSFQSVGTPVPHTVREIYRAHWHWRNPKVAQFSITGSGFLKQMVRNIVGTQLLIERKGFEPEMMTEIISKKDRKVAGPPAGPQGLFLWRVYYPQDLDKRCREL